MQGFARTVLLVFTTRCAIFWDAFWKKCALNCNNYKCSIRTRKTGNDRIRSPQYVPVGNRDEIIKYMNTLWLRNCLSWVACKDVWVFLATICFFDMRLLEIMNWVKLIKDKKMTLLWWITNLLQLRTERAYSNSLLWILLFLSSCSKQF